MRSEEKKLNRKSLVLTTISVIVIAVLLMGFFLNPTYARSIRAAIQGSVPTYISYQGYLEDDGGQPINGSVTLQLGLYAAASGGSPIW